jgi:hypothetical protein
LTDGPLQMIAHLEMDDNSSMACSRETIYKDFVFLIRWGWANNYIFLLNSINIK